jgi:hypothetical protein
MKPLKPEQTKEVGGAAYVEAIDADWPPYQIEPHRPEQPVAQPIPAELSPDSEAR